MTGKHPKAQRIWFLLLTFIGSSILVLEHSIAHAFQDSTASKRSEGSSPYDGWDRLLNQRFDRESDQNVGENFKLATSPEVNFLVREAQDAIRNESFGKAVRTLQELIDTFSNSVIQVSRTQYLGAGEVARFLLSGLPPKGREAYERLVARTVGPQLKEAMRQSDRQALRRLVTRYDLSEPGREALLVLADLSFESGDFESASLLWRRALSFPQGENDQKRSLLLAKLGLSQAALGQNLDSIVNDLGAAEVEASGEEQSAGEMILREAGDVPPIPTNEWPTLGGANDRNRPAPQPLLDATLPKAWDRSLFNGATVNPYQGRGYTYPFFPIRVGDDLIVSDSIDVWAINLFSDELQWYFEGPLHGADTRAFPGETRGRRGRISPMSKNAIAGLSAERGVVVANVLRPIGADYAAHRLDDLVINTAIPTRSLVALDVSTGEVLWSTDRREGPKAEFLNRLSIPSPPAILGSVVAAYGYYFEGGVNAFLVLLDLKTGELIADTSICISQIELTMFGMPFHEHTTSAVAADGNSLYVCTNLGLMVCLDPVTGWVRWISEYETIPIQAAKHFRRPSPRRIFWKNNPPMLSDKHLVIAPHDASAMFAFEKSTGKMTWQNYDMAKRGSREASLDTLVGIKDGILIATGTGNNVVQGIEVESGRRLWRRFVREEHNEAIAGKGQITGDNILIPTTTGIASYQLRTGLAKNSLYSWENPLPTDPSGNLLVFSDAVVTSGRGHLQVYFDLQRALAQATARFEGGEAAFYDFLLLADLSRLKGDDVEAIRYYDRALERSREERVAARDLKRVEAGLYRSCLEVGEFHESFDRLEEAVAQFERARTFAPTPDEDLRAGILLLGALKGLDDPDAFVALTEELDASYGHWVRNPAPGIEGPVGLLLGRSLADYFRERGLFVREVESLQKLMGRYGEIWYGESSVRDYCFQRIRDRILDEGREIYRRLDEQASRLAADAVEGNDPEAMLHVLNAYPNAKGVADYAMTLGHLLLKAERYPELFKNLSRFLDDYPDHSEVVSLRLLLAHAALEIGNRDLALTLTKWASQRAGSDDSGAFPEIPEVARRVPVTPKSIGIVSRGAFPKEGGRPDMIEVRSMHSQGKALPSVLLKATTTVSAVPTLETEGQLRTQWEVRFEEGVWNLSEAFLVDDLFVMAVERFMVGVDAKSGIERWRHALRADAASLSLNEGAFVVATDRFGRGDSFQLVAVEPHTGSILWDRDLDGQAPNWIKIADGIVVVERPQNRASRSVIDGYSLATGRPLWEGIPYSKRSQGELLLIPEWDLILVPSWELDANGNVLRDAVSLNAYRSSDMSVLWTLSNADVQGAPIPLSRSYLVPAMAPEDDEDRPLAIEVRKPNGRHEFLIVNGATGEALRKPISISRQWESLERTTSDGRFEEQLFLVRRTDRGRVSPKDPVRIAALDPFNPRDEISWNVVLEGGQGQFVALEAHRFGDSLVVSYDIVPPGVNKNITDLYLIDVRAGTVIDRQNLDPPDAKYFSRAKLARMGSSLVVRKARHVYSLELDGAGR